MTRQTIETMKAGDAISSGARIASLMPRIVPGSRGDSKANRRSRFARAETPLPAHPPRASAAIADSMPPTLRSADMNRKRDAADRQLVTVFQFDFAGDDLIIDERTVAAPQVAQTKGLLAFVNDQLAMAAADVVAGEPQVAITIPANDELALTVSEIRSLDDDSLLSRFVKTFECDHHDVRLPFGNDV